MLLFYLSILTTAFSVFLSVSCTFIMITLSFLYLTTDGYVDPDEVIKKKREERREREKVIRLEQAKKREEILSKQRFKLPKIVVSQYEEPETLQYSRPQSLTNERQSVLPSLVNIPSGLQNQIDKENDESEVESQGSKGDSLALPELESSCQERNYFENTQQGEEQVGRILPELEQKVPTKADTDVTDSISQGIECSVETVEGKNVKTLLDINNVVRLDLQIELESDVVSESVDAKVDEQIVLNRKNETVDTERSHEQQKENINSVDVSSTEALLEIEQVNNTVGTEQVYETLETEQVNETIETVQVKDTVELDSIASAETKEQPQEEGIQSRVDKKELSEHGEDKEQIKKIVMNYLAPPSVPLLAGENGSDNGAIADADDTGNHVVELTLEGSWVVFWLIKNCL